MTMDGMMNEDVVAGLFLLLTLYAIAMFFYTLHLTMEEDEDLPVAAARALLLPFSILAAFGELYRRRKMAARRRRLEEERRIEREYLEAVKGLDPGVAHVDADGGDR